MVGMLTAPASMTEVYGMRLASRCNSECFFGVPFARCKEMAVKSQGSFEVRVSSLSINGSLSFLFSCISLCCISCTRDF